MKGFVALWTGKCEILLNINHIVSVQPHRDEDKCYITTTLVIKDGTYAYTVSHSYHQVKALIEAAQK